MMNEREFTEKTFKVLDALHRQEISTHRQLAEISGVSLGQANYILKSLVKKGLVKIRNFQKNPHKLRYAYLLTPTGIQTKSRLTGRFVIHKIKEYKEIQGRLVERLSDIEKKGFRRIVFIGPPMVADLVESTLNQKVTELTLVGSYEDPDRLRDLDPHAFDVALLFDDYPMDMAKAAEGTAIPPEKCILLW
jgi:MarR family transcriptional regulator, temperature-dependent positive regulator of motility